MLSRFRYTSILSFLLVCWLPLSAAPARPSGIPVDANFDEKHQVWVTATATSQSVWYASGSKKAEGGLKQERRDGPWVFFYESGQKRAEGEYRNGRMEGPWKHYFKSGSLQSEGEYKNNSKTGNWTFYFDKGKKKSEGQFAGGLKNGSWTEYYPSGGVFFKGQYVSNLATGTWSYYFEDGTFFQAGRFTEDVRTGVWKICITPGGPCGEENYRQNEPPRVSGLPKAEAPPGSNDVRNKPNGASEILESMESTDAGNYRDGAPSPRGWDRLK